MPPKFEELTLDEFDAMVDQFEFTRHVDAVHMHHTWRPRRSDFRGVASIEAMWRHHTETNGWDDIAQHVTIDPLGRIWTGRNWNLRPASASGFNGDKKAGPFMFETIGDFDTGHEPLDGPQRKAVIHVIAKIWDRFMLPPSSLRFHREMNAGKTCPGSGIDKAAILVEAQAELATISANRRAIRGMRWAAGEFSPSATRVRDLLAFDARPRTVGAGEHDELEEGSSAPDDGRRGSGLSQAELDLLRPHVVTTREGRLAATTGELPTSEHDVDAIFERYLPEWIATGHGGPLRIVLWAHGGLNDEGAGLGIAAKQVSWWRANGVYPIHFVWETGFLASLQQLLFGARGRDLARDVWDWTSDPGIEAAARGLGIPAIWSTMKRNAELASGAGGGARYVAQRLGAWCRDHAADGPIEIYAAGHSAGSIFHAHFLPVAFEHGVRRVEELFLLAPAIRVELFKEKIVPLVGPRVRKLTMFTMTDALERADSVGGVYRKSLLYLVSRALEGLGGGGILGLQSSIRDDADLQSLFALDGGPWRNAQIIWSDGAPPPLPREGSTSSSHGGFDDDVATMNTLAYRATRADHIVEFPQTRAAAAPSAPARATAPPAGRRLAVCVGIDRYPDPRYVLAGCVADARDWRGGLGSAGFDVRMHEDGEATRAAILSALEDLLTSSRPGDVLAFQFAGHGTQLTDLDGDEDDGQDEAFVPYDFAAGAFLLDDDFRQIFARLPGGVSLTCFFDCCHSGTITRVFGAPPPPPPAGAMRRFISATPEMENAHRAFRSRGFRAVPPGADRASMRRVVFSACLDHEVAYELGGRGEFSKRAVPILRRGADQFTNATFHEAVVRAFGASPRQNPKLDCPDDAMVLGLLSPVVAGPGRPTTGGAAPSPGAPAGNGGPRLDLPGVGRRLREIADLLDARD